MAERVGVGARDTIDHVLDEGTFRSWDVPALQAPANAEYVELLRGARARTGLDESVTTGEGTLRGRRVAVMAGEVAFLGGSIGVAATERLVLAIERATAQGIPLLASPVSGGTRMQEGTVAFLQMVKLSGAIAAHKAAGLPYLVYLRNRPLPGRSRDNRCTDRVRLARPGHRRGSLGPRSGGSGDRRTARLAVPLPLEGASAIVYRDTSHAAEIAAEQGVRAGDLMRAGIVDERPDAADEPGAFCLRLGAALADELFQLMPMTPGERARRRHQRYRRLGL